MPLDAIPTGITRAEIDVTAAGRIGLHLGDVRGLTLSIGGKLIDPKSQVEVDLPKGLHTLEIRVDAAARGGEGVRVEIKDLPGSSGHAQPVGGR